MSGKSAIPVPKLEDPKDLLVPGELWQHITHLDCAVRIVRKRRTWESLVDWESVSGQMPASGSTSERAFLRIFTPMRDSDERARLQKPRIHQP